MPELIGLARKLRDEQQVGEFRARENEIALYGALASSKGARRIIGGKELRSAVIG